jgi:membrane AbrB-like protein
MTGRRDPWLRGFAGVAAGAVAGYVCSLLHTPIPWMLGPLLALAVLRVGGVNITAPPGARQVGQWIIGSTLGLYFAPQVIRDVAAAWPLLALGALFAIAAGYIGGVVLSRLSGVDRTTAVFASVPGGATEMSVLGERFGARVDQVAAAQSLRILVVVVVVPFAFAWLDAHGSDRYQPSSSAFDATRLAGLLAATLAGGFVAQWRRVPNAFILGALAVAIPLTASAIPLSTMPAPLSNAGQCLLGCTLGSRFEPDFLRGAPRFIAAVVATVLGAIAMAAGFAWALAWIAGYNPWTLGLGLAPGGMAEMCVTAKMLQLGVPLVTAFHVTRMAVLLVCTAPLFAWLQRRRRARLGGSGR